MIRAFSSGRGRFALLFLTLLCIQTVTLHADEPQTLDVLDRPAQQLKGSGDSVQLAITRAGARLVSVGEKGIILLSDDNGNSWRQASHVPVSVTLTDTQFTDAQTGFAVGHSGVLLTTEDGGENWTLQLDGTDIATLYQSQAERLNDSEQQQAALREAGYLIQDGADKPLLGLNFFDDQRGSLLGAYGLALKTEDGGQQWTPFALELPNDQGMHLYQHIHVDGDEYIVGERGTLFMRQGHLVSFVKLPSAYNGSYFGVLATSDDELLLYGLRGNLWSYSISSAQWRQLDYPYEISITAAVKSADGSKVFFGDANGNLVQLNMTPRRSLARVKNIGSYITDLIQVDGALVASTVRGNKRLAVSL